MAKETTNEQLDQAPNQKIDLQAFLGTKSLKRAEKLYYTRHFGKVYKELTITEWSKLTGLA